jgi:hypothetical protein
MVNPHLTSNDLLVYLTHLKELKKDLGEYSYSKDEDLYIIYDKNNIPKLTLTEKIFEIFQEIQN